MVQLRGEDDGHNDAVDGNDFAEDDGDQVLRSYPWRLDTSADDGDTGRPDSPGYMSELYATACMGEHTTLTLRLTGRCIVRCLNSRKCTVIRFRGIARPSKKSANLHIHFMCV
jgi:hypothetical protein